MQRELEFLILGPLEVRAGGSAVPLRTAKQRALLAILLLHRGEVVSSHRLIDALWGVEPPETALNTLQVYVSQLRKALAAGSSEGTGADLLITRSPGYLLQVDAAQLDSARFERLAEDGMAAMAAGDPAAASECLGHALALWRGQPLGDFADDEFARGEIAHLERLRQGVIEEKVEADLALGRHIHLLAELEALAASHPQRERLQAQLMVALYRSGRQAEALDVYRKTRETLVAELGIDPSPALQQLERAILNQDPGLDLETGPSDPAPSEPASVLPPREQPERVRKPVTSLFLDVVLVRSMGELDPDLLVQVLPEIHSTVSRVIDSHQGTNLWSEGGETRAVFGVPTAHEDDALRAIRAACDARDEIGALSADLERRLGVAAILRAGVSSGRVLVTPDAAMGMVGPSLAVAARLRDAARAGEILLSEETARLVRDAIEVEAMAPPIATPEGETLPAQRLVAVIPGAPGITRRSDTPLVGRRAQLQLLVDGLGRAVAERRPQLVTVCGAAGIGKSRLARELLSLIVDRARVLEGRCPAYGEGTTFSPLIEIVRQLAGDSHPLEAIRRILSTEREADLIVERLGAAIGVLDSSGEPETTFWAARKLLEALARERPLVVILDDLHWGEPTMLDLTEHLVDWAVDAPILLVCLSRPELLSDRPAWAGGRRGISSFTLEPLSDEESSALLDLLAGPDLDPERRAAIVAAGSGNPLFLEQLLAMTVEADDDQIPVAVPSTIQSLLAARLDQLEAEEARVLETAAVIGEEFWPRALAELCREEDEIGLGGRLHTLIRKDTIEPFASTLPGEDALRFRHTLIREAAYQRLPKARRADLHERFADWLETRQHEIGGEYEEIIGHHLERAHEYRVQLGRIDDDSRELSVRAGYLLGVAGTRARKRGHSRTSVGLLSRALAHLPDDQSGRDELLLLFAEELLEVGDFQRADDVLAEMERVADEREDAALKAHVVVLRLRRQLQVDSHVNTYALERSVEGAIELFAAIGDEQGQARAWTVLAWLPWIRCEAEKAEVALRRGAEHARRAGDERAESECLSYLLGTALFGPLPVGEGIERCQEVLEHPSKLLQATAHRALAVLQAMAGSTSDARELVLQSKAILDDLGLRYLAASATTEYGAVELLAGSPERAEAELREGYDALSQMGEVTGLSTIAAALAEALLVQEKLEEALYFLDISQVNAVGDDLQTIVPERRVRASALALTGEFDEAENLAHAAVELAERTDWLNLKADTRLGLAHVLHSAGKTAAAGAAAEEALALYRQKGNAVSAANAKAFLTKRLARA
jgi:DNA-binding SARP family transcriptional activator/class 3 adenylate cyclase